MMWPCSRRRGFGQSGARAADPSFGVDCEAATGLGWRRWGNAIAGAAGGTPAVGQGAGRYVAAARELRKRGRDIEFLLAGDPDPDNLRRCRTIPPRDGWSKGCCAGSAMWMTYPHCFASVDVVVLPRLPRRPPKGADRGGAGGLPLITTDVPGCREVVTDGVDGLLVPVKDSRALAAAIASCTMTRRCARAWEGRTRRPGESTEDRDQRTLCRLCRSSFRRRDVTRIIFAALRAPAQRCGLE